MRRQLLFALFATLPALALAQPTEPQLAGTWKMIAAYNLYPDGSRTEPYGPAPRGLLYMGKDGQYAVQIYHTLRKPFTSPDYTKATYEEYHDAVITVSTHFGNYSVDAPNHMLTFRISAAHKAAWDNSVQKRPFELAGDVLSWRVPPQPGGHIPVSVWKRIP